MFSSPIKERMCDVIFQFSNRTVLHRDGSWIILFQDLHTKAQFAKSLVGSLWKMGSMINLCNSSSSKLILNSGSGLSFKEGGRKTYLAFFVSFAVDAAKICSDNWVLIKYLGWSDRLWRWTIRSPWPCWRLTRRLWASFLHPKNEKQSW